MPESRRERRERELAEAAGPAVAASAEPTAIGSSDADAAPAAVALPSRRARRDIRGLEHLLLAPAEAPATPREAMPHEDTPHEDTEPAASEPVAQAVAVEAPIAPATDAAAAPDAVAVAADAAPEAEPAPAALHFDAEDLPGAHVTSVHTMTFSHDDESIAPTRAPRRSRSSSTAAAARSRAVPRLRRSADSSRSSKKRTIASTVVMVATAGLVATSALPAYAYSTPDSSLNATLTATSELGIQSLTVSGVNGQSSTRDDYSTTGNVAAMDSTTGTTVSPTVQALAAELMADVASGKLVGSVPDHIVEIRNLANGIAVPGCGVDYRVLQTIKVAVDNFDKVGVSDINRACTGQIEGAGTASSHYKDGGGHAVDFYILNGHGLTGADSDSLKLIRLLDPLVPKGSGLGQSECRPSIAVTNFAPFPDTCTHMHVDFGAAQGVSLKS